tara:strand:- start:1124 stop:2092 length:969 start_codon:yes stop_codon:yes gene_type:complete
MSKDAEKYLKAGPPFVGDSQFSDLALIKKAGGSWSGSTKKWVAKDRETFIALVETGRWHPINCAHPNDVVAQIRKEQREEHDRDMKSRTVAKSVALTPEEQERIRRERNGISADTPKQLAELAAMGITPEMIRPAMSHSGLGPYGGQSDAFRLLRGLLYKIITAEQVISGKITVEDKNATEEKQKRRNARLAQETAKQFASTEAVSMAISSVWGSEAQPTRMQVWEREGYVHPEQKYADTCCEVCGALIMDQFLECSCAATWEQCNKCGYKRRLENDMCVQECACNRAADNPPPAPPPPSPPREAPRAPIRFFKRPRPNPSS